jgi:hypothetical protein
MRKTINIRVRVIVEENMLKEFARGDPELRQQVSPLLPWQADQAYDS